MIKQLFIIAIYSICSTMLAQVGIGTSSPDATLDVNGTVRVTNIPAISVAEPTQGLGGISTAEKLNKTDLGINIFLSETEGLITAPVARAMGNIIITPGDYSGGGRINNYDINIGSGEVNELASFFVVSGYTTTTKLTGMTGGYHGRRVTLYLSESSTFNFVEDSSYSDPKNRFYTLSASQIGASGNGLIDMVYNENEGDDGLGRWIVIKFRD